MSSDATIRRYAGNALWLLIGDAVAKAASFLFVVLVARAVGTREYGYFNFAISFVPLFLILGTWGLDVALFREIARYRERVSAIFASGMAVRTALGVGAILLSFALAPLFVETGRAMTALVLVALALLLDDLSHFVSTVFKAFERMKFRALMILVNRVVTTALALVVLLVHPDLLWACGAYLIGSGVAFVFALFTLRRHFPRVAMSDATRAEMRDLLKKGTPLAIAAVLNMAVFRIDAVMLQAMEGAVAVAMYGIAYRFLDSFLFVAWGLSNVALPRITRAGRDPSSIRTFEATVAAAFAFYAPLAAAAPFTADWIVRTVFGGRYGPAGEAVPWLLGAALFYALAYISRMAAIALGRRSEIAWVAGAALAVNVAANLYAIPRHGFVGAAVVTFITEVAEAAATTAVFVKAGGRFSVTGVVAVPLLASGIVAGVLAAAPVSDALEVALGAAVYLIALLAVARLIAPTESRRAISAFRRNPA